MAVLQMQRISICALKKDRKAIMQKLQALGVVEPSTVVDTEHDDTFTTVDTREKRAQFEKYAHLYDQALEVLDRYSPEKAGLLASFEGKESVDGKMLESLAARGSELLQKATGIINSDKATAENNAAVQKLEGQAEALSPWMSLNVPLSTTGTRRTALLMGTMPPETTLDTIYSAVAKGAPDANGIDAEIVSSDQDACYMSVICFKEDARHVEDALRAAGFTRLAPGIAKTPAEQAADIDAEIKETAASTAELREKIAAYASSRGELRIAADYCRMRAKGYEVGGEMPQSDRTFVISGYIPKKKSEAVKNAFMSSFDCAVDVDELKDSEESPVLLSNNKFSESMEGVTESYGMPSRGEIDPTSIVSVCYAILFGLMLSDAGYGLLMAAACFILVRKYPKMPSGTRKSLKMFGISGIATIFWGIMFSSYFGDAPAVVARVFFGAEFEIQPLWFTPLNEPMKMLLWCLAFGIVHLFIGLGIKGYEELRDRKYADFVGDVLVWYMLIAGLIMMFVPSTMFQSMAQSNISYPAWWSMTAKVLAIAGAAGVVVMSDHTKKNWGVRVISGLYNLYGSTSWLSDVLSYSRLLALGLATGVIASVINMMAEMVAANAIGKIIFAVILIVGHILNMAINVLGAYVHTNRLQFVEFFGKFYDGGGRKFEPLTAESKYIDLKEEF